MVWVELRVVNKGGQGSWIFPAITSITNPWLLLMERRETSNLLNSPPTYRSWLTSSCFSDSPMSWHSNFFDSVDTTLWCYHSIDTSLVVLSHGTIYLGCSSTFWLCGQYPFVLRFKWNLKVKKALQSNFHLRPRHFSWLTAAPLDNGLRIFHCFILL